MPSAKLSPVAAPLPDAEYLRRYLIRKFLTAQVDGPGSPLAAGFPVAAAEVAMSVIGPVLEGRDAEIDKLRRELRDENDRILELIAQNRHLAGQPERACCCDHEGWYDSRCACCNRKAAAEAGKNGSEGAE